MDRGRPKRGFLGKSTDAYLSIDAASYLGGKQFFTYESYVTIHAETHQVLLDYGEAMVENRKASNFLEIIEFSLMDIGKATVLYNLQMTNSFYWTTYYLDDLIQNNKKVHLRYISMEG